MKATIKKCMTVWTLVMLVITSCTKEGPEGPIGPVGAQGAQGIQGEQGPQGIAGQDGQDGLDGEDGQDGNANVIASAWIEPTTADMYLIDNARYKAIALNDNMGYAHTHSGTILVYYDDDITVHSLPYYAISPTSGELSKSVVAEINHASRTLYLKITKFGSDLTPQEYLWNPSGPAYAKGVRFRYVIIPNTTSGKMASVDFEKMRYQEVMDYFQLPY